MAKQALCVQSYEQLSNLVQKNIDFVEANLIDREICENPENGHQQLIPYVSFYATDFEAGKLMFIQYQRKDQGEGDERIAGKTSIGFGGHIDSIDDIVAEEIITNEDGTQTFKMSLANLIETGYKTAYREVKEELGLDLQAMGLSLEDSDTAFFTGDLAEEVNRVHLGLSIQKEVTVEQFNELKEKAQYQPEEIQALDVLGINLDVIVEEMDLSRTLDKVTCDLVENRGLEDWSGKIFNYVTLKEINRLLSVVEYKDLVMIAKVKISEAQRKAQRGQEEAAKQEASTEESVEVDQA